ncbi:MAG: hypothetical protein EXR77_01480 [Myxococcales bacterium]|nr:hypothetical protein [Myxococcales bacterium]
MSSPPTIEESLPSTANRVPGSNLPIAAGKPEAPIEVLIGRWMLIGCGATALVGLTVAVFLAWVMVAGLMDKSL